jgi:predicted nucleic acid-binding protein
MTLYDSDVVIWYTRGHRVAAELLNADPDVTLSVITLFEIYRGARDRSDLRSLQAEVPKLFKRVYPLTPAIGARGLEICMSYSLQTALSIADCLIAATALEHNLPLATGNIKHYGVIRGLKLLPFKA